MLDAALSVMSLPCRSVKEYLYWILPVKVPESGLAEMKILVITSNRIYFFNERELTAK